jgi:hypothetical protein
MHECCPAAPKIVHAVALCTAFILIAAVLFGTLSFRPF